MPCEGWVRRGRWAAASCWLLVPAPCPPGQVHGLKASTFSVMTVSRVISWLDYTIWLLALSLDSLTCGALMAEMETRKSKETPKVFGALRGLLLDPSGVVWLLVSSLHRATTAACLPESPPLSVAPLVPVSGFRDPEFSPAHHPSCAKHLGPPPSRRTKTTNRGQ